MLEGDLSERAICPRGRFVLEGELSCNQRREQHKQKTKSARYLIQTFFMEGKIETLPEVLTNKELTTLGKIILPWKFLSGK